MVRTQIVRNTPALARLIIPSVNGLRSHAAHPVSCLESLSSTAVHGFTLSDSVVSDSATPWTGACRAPLWDFPGENTGAACHSFLQGIFPTQGSNVLLLHLLLWQRDVFPSEPQEAPRIGGCPLSAFCSSWGHYELWHLALYYTILSFFILEFFFIEV